MEFIAAVCPQCAGNLQVPDDRDTIKCMYCGTDIIIKDASDSKHKKLKNLATLAQSALNSSNYAESYKYFTEILELKINDSDAWYGKGLSAGYLSTNGSYRCRDLIDAFEMAIKYSKNEEVEVIKKKCYDSMFEIGKTLVASNKSYAGQFAKVSGTAATYINNQCLVIEMLMKACEYCPENSTIQRYIASYCHTDPSIVMDMAFSGNVCNNEDQKNYIKNSVTECTSIIKKIDPNFRSSAQADSIAVSIGVLIGLAIAVFILYKIVTN